MFQDLDCSPLQQDHHAASSRLSAPRRFFSTLFVRHTLTNPQSSLCLRLSLSFRRDDLFCFSPLLLHSSAALGSAPSSITLSGFLIPTLETPVPIQENNRLKKRIQSPEYLPFLCLCLFLPPSSPQISGKINSREAKPESRGESSTRG